MWANVTPMSPDCHAPAGAEIADEQEFRESILTYASPSFGSPGRTICRKKVGKKNG
jgi:hypothetical protein